MSQSGQDIEQPAIGPDRAGNLSRIYELLRFVAVAAGFILAVWLVSDVLVVIFAATLLAVILHGLASLLHRYLKLPHWLALILVVVVLTLAVVGLAVEAGPSLSEQATSLRQALLSQAQSLQSRLSQTAWGHIILEQVPSWLGGTKEGASAPSIPSGLAGSLAGYLGTAVGIFGTLAVVLIAGLYFAASPATYVNGVLRLVSPSHRDRAKLYVTAAGEALWAWSAGQALDMLVVGCLSGLGLWLIGVPLALVLGVVAGLLNFVPYIGAIVGAIPAIVIAFSVSVTAGLETIALYVVIQGFEGNVLAPLIQNRAVHMPPGLTVLSQTAFGAILGIPGLIFATPLTAAILAIADKATTPLQDKEKI